MMDLGLDFTIQNMRATIQNMDTHKVGYLCPIEYFAQNWPPGGTWSTHILQNFSITVLVR